MAIIDLSVTMIECGSLAGSYSQISWRSLLVCIPSLAKGLSL